jgi:RNA polymerase-binding transcription factor DksA
MPNVVAFDLSKEANTNFNLITEVLGLKVFEKKLYEELRDFERELDGKLKDNLVHQKIKKYVEAELKDIQSTLHKLECGEFGKCEMSGELIPYDLLYAVPTAKSLKDFNDMKSYLKKPHTYHYN